MTWFDMWGPSWNQKHPYHLGALPEWRVPKWSAQNVVVSVKHEWCQSLSCLYGLNQWFTPFCHGIEIWHRQCGDKKKKIMNGMHPHRSHRGLRFFFPLIGNVRGISWMKISKYIHMYIVTICYKVYELELRFSLLCRVMQSISKLGLISNKEWAQAALELG